MTDVASCNNTEEVVPRNCWYVVGKYEIFLGSELSSELRFAYILDLALKAPDPRVEVTIHSELLSDVH